MPRLDQASGLLAPRARRIIGSAGGRDGCGAGSHEINGSNQDENQSGDDDRDNSLFHRSASWHKQSARTFPGARADPNLREECITPGAQSYRDNVLTGQKPVPYTSRLLTPSNE